MELLDILRFITRHPLNSQRKLAAVIRFLKWQFSSRLAPGPIVYPWVNGSRFFVRKGEAGLTGNIYTGLHEFQDMAFLLHFLRQEDLFVDVGANVGAYTILACRVVGASAIAFEPVPETFTRLGENMRINHLHQKARCVKKALGAQTGELMFSSDSDTTNHALAVGEKCNSVATVDVTLLDAELENETPALIKIDVEGYELPVLQGAEAVLRRPMLRAVIVELNGSGSRYGFNESSIVKLMLDHGFGMYGYDPFQRKLTRLTSSNSKGNTLFIRDKDFVMERLLVAPRVMIHDRQI